MYLTDIHPLRNTNLNVLQPYELAHLIACAQRVVDDTSDCALNVPRRDIHEYVDV